MNPLDQQALINHVARKWKRRFECFGYDFDDLFQEGFLVCLNVMKKYDPSKGYAFSTYFVTSLNNHFLNMLVSLKKVPLESVEHGDFSLLDMVKDEAENPEEEVLVEAEVRTAIAGMSPLARMMTELLIDPPCFIKEQFAALEAKRKMAQQAGVDERYPSELNSTFLASLLSAAGVCSNELSRAKDEIKQLECAHAV